MHCVFKRGLIAYAAAAVFLVVNSIGVQAEDKKPSKSFRVEGVTVTAQKREENIQKVPVSMEAFSQVDLEEAGIYKVEELTRFTPNIYFQRNSYENKIVIRGVSSMGDTLSSPVGLYIDDVPLTFNYMFNWDLFDLERVEVLRGPQGTAYGRNTESGLIKIVTKQPGNSLSAKAYGDVGFYDTDHGNVPSYQFGGGVSGPLVKDRLYLGLAGRFERSDGFMKNIYYDDNAIAKIDRLNARGNLRWTPSRAWDIAFIADILNTDDGDGLYRYTSGPYKTKRDEVNYDYPIRYAKQKGNGLNLRLKYQGGWFDMVSVSGRRYWKAETGGDSDLSPKPLRYSDANYKTTLLNQELRFSSPGQLKGPWKWLAGLCLSKQDDDIDFYSNSSGRIKSDIEALTYAIFGQATYTLFDRLHLTGGLRFEKTDQKGDQSISENAQGPMSWNKDMDTQTTLPRLAISYDLTKKVMAYVSASKGYLSGGYRFWGNTRQGQFSYEPEYTWNYELGVKTSLWGDRVILNASIFYINMQDKQVQEYSPEMGNSKLRNAAEAHSQGFELDMKAKVIGGLEVFAGFGYTEAKIDDWVATEVDWNTGEVFKYDYDGKYLPDVPKYTYNVGVQYRHNTGLMARVDLLGTGEYYNEAKNLVKTDAYQIVNLRFGYESDDFDVVLWAKNLFDKDYFTKEYDWGGAFMGYQAPPRMLGVRLVWRY